MAGFAAPAAAAFRRCRIPPGGPCGRCRRAALPPAADGRIAFDAGICDRLPGENGMVTRPGRAFRLSGPVGRSFTWSDRAATGGLIRIGNVQERISR